MTDQTVPPIDPAPGAAPGTGPSTSESSRTRGPRVSAEQMRDVDRLRRSTTDRYVAGVAGGLGRHFDIDPNVVRVALVVLTLFGGAGVLVYVAVWVLVPEDDKARAVVVVRSDWLRALLFITVVISLSMVFGAPFFGGDWGVPLPLLVLGLVAVAIYATRQQRQESGQPPVPWGATVPASARPPEGTTMTMTDSPSGTTGYPTTEAPYEQQPPAWMPPQPPAYVPSPRPRRTGPVLFWPTLALIAIGSGTLGIFDTAGEVMPTAYAALALAITGAMLVVGAFVARPGGLIALGLVGVLALVVTLAVGVTDGPGPSADDIRVYPPTASALAPEYRITTGSLTLDLTNVEDLSQLDGRVVALGVGAGEITVIVPRDLEVDVKVEVDYAGEIAIGDLRREGLRQSLSSTLTADTAAAPSMDLLIDANVAEITVRQSS